MHEQIKRLNLIHKEELKCIIAQEGDIAVSIIIYNRFF